MTKAETNEACSHISVPEDVELLAMSYEYAKNGSEKKALCREMKTEKRDTFVNAAWTIGLALAAYGAYLVFVSCNAAYQATPYDGLLMLGVIAGGTCGIAAGVMALLGLTVTVISLVNWIKHNRRLNQFKDNKRSEREDTIMQDKLAHMAYRVVESAKAVNTMREELKLHKNMIDLDMGMFDQERAEEILEKAHERTCFELERVKTLMQLRERRGTHSADLTEITALLDESSANALCELKAKAEIAPEDVLASMHTTLITDDLNAELGDTNAIVRKRESQQRQDNGKKSQIAKALQAKATP